MNNAPIEEIEIDSFWKRKATREVWKVTAIDRVGNVTLINIDNYSINRKAEQILALYDESDFMTFQSSEALRGSAILKQLNGHSIILTSEPNDVQEPPIKPLPKLRESVRRYRSRLPTKNKDPRPDWRPGK